MNRSIKKLINYKVLANDGLKGKVDDFLFDEESWVIRYLEADLGSIFEGRKVLIPKAFLENPDWQRQEFAVSMSSKEIENCPALEANLPASRAYEAKLNSHLGFHNYWTPATIPLGGGGVSSYQAINAKIPSDDVLKKEPDTKLRSFKEVEGYHIKTLDGKLGHLEDIIIEDEHWEILYAVVDTSNWQPWSKKVLINIHWMEKISYLKQYIKVDLTTEAIKSAPEFDPAVPINAAYELKLYDYYGRPKELQS